MDNDSSDDNGNHPFVITLRYKPFSPESADSENGEGSSRPPMFGQLEVQPDTDIAQVLPKIAARGIAVWDTQFNYACSGYKTRGPLDNGTTYDICSSNPEQTKEVMRQFR